MGPEHSLQHSCWSCGELCMEYHAHPHSLACLRPPSERCGMESPQPSAQRSHWGYKEHSRTKSKSLNCA